MFRLYALAMLELSGVLRQTVDFMDEILEPTWMYLRRVWRSSPEDQAISFLRAGRARD